MTHRVAPQYTALAAVVILAAGIVGSSRAPAETRDSGAVTGPRGRILQVGPHRALRVPSAAAAIARDGDRIRIDAGDYHDCAVWRRSDLLIEGIGGRARMLDKVCDNQAIWLITGDRVAIRSIDFASAHSRFNNGAGIKFVGRTLSVADCSFIDNENGILVGPRPRSRVRIAGSLFRGNGRCDPDCAHGVYVSHVARLTVVDSVFLNQRTAHHIKSRALVSEIIGNRIADGPDGTASYSIDLPNAGAAIIRDNDIEKGPLSENLKAMIAIGAEGETNPPGDGIRILDNRLRNDNPAADAFVRNFGKRDNVVMSGNRFFGPGAALAVPNRAPLR